MLSSVKPTLVTALCQIYYLFSAAYEVQIDFHSLRRNLDRESPHRFPKTHQAPGRRCKTLSVCSRRTKVMSGSELRSSRQSSVTLKLIFASLLAVALSVPVAAQDSSQSGAPPAQSGATATQENLPATQPSQEGPGKVQVLTPFPRRLLHSTTRTLIRRKTTAAENVSGRIRLRSTLPARFLVSMSRTRLEWTRLLRTANSTSR